MKVTEHTVVITSPTDGALLDVVIEIDPTDCPILPETGEIQTENMAIQFVGATVHPNVHPQLP
jgi:hypothetical protein